MDALAENLDRRARDPEARRKMFAQMKTGLERLKRNWTTARETWKGDAIRQQRDSLASKVRASSISASVLNTEANAGS